MKDDRGLYYFPFPDNKRVRMYVRDLGADVCFRMWNADDPELWKQHGWVPHKAIRQAAGMYRKGPFDPDQAYDIDLGRALLGEDGN